MRIYYEVEDLEKCFEFAVKYHLTDYKTNFNRTTGQYRGLGSIINDFFFGKLIEIGVAKTIQQYNSNIDVNLDFDIHSLNQTNYSDPDIISVKQEDKFREPKLYIEIKNISDSDRWVGLTVEQYSTILNSDILNGNPEKLFLIYGTLMTANVEKDPDPLGIFLRKKINTRNLNGFCDIKEFYLEIKHVLNGIEYERNKKPFDAGNYFYETEIFSEAFDEKSANKIRNSGFENITLENNKLPVIMMNNMPPPSIFGDFNYRGEIKLYLKRNRMSNRVYVECMSDVEVRNEVLGKFFLEKGKVYEVYFTTIGRDPILKRNNLWVARRNLKNITENTPEESLVRISNAI